MSGSVLEAEGTVVSGVDKPLPLWKCYQQTPTLPTGDPLSVFLVVLALISKGTGVLRWREKAVLNVSQPVLVSSLSAHA